MHHKSDKLEPRSRKGVFLGYPEGVKGYRVIISRDVVFNEDEFLCLSVTPAFLAPVHVEFYFENEQVMTLIKTLSLL